MDKRWRARTAKELRPILERGRRTGAGSLLRDRRSGVFIVAQTPGRTLLGRIFSHTMLVRGAGEGCCGGEWIGSGCRFFEADALRLPF